MNDDTSKSTRKTPARKKRRAKRKSKSSNKKTTKPLKIADLKPDVDNPREITEEALKSLSVSMDEFGDLAGITWNRKTGELVAGHQRLKALKDKHGKALHVKGGSVVTPDGESFPIRIVSWDRDRQRLANIVANSPLIAGVYTESAIGMIEEMEATFPEMAAALHLENLAEYVAEQQGGNGDDVKDGLTDPDDVPEAPEEPISKPGDLWILGEHRLLCGDCTKKEDVERVMGGEKDFIMVTDPPYCSGGYQEAQKAGGTYGNIAGDNLSTRSYIALIKNMLETSRAQVVYIFTDWRMWISLFDAVEASGIATRSMIVWAKDTPGLGSIWRAQHEIVLFGSRVSSKRKDGVAGTGNILRATRTGNVNHYTEKPVELISQILVGDAVAREGTPVYDPFSGSGTTIIAAEQLSRRCFAIEIEPRYIDVAVRRWELFTGKKAKRSA